MIDYYNQYDFCAKCGKARRYHYLVDIKEAYAGEYSSDRVTVEVNTILVCPHLFDAHTFEPRPETEDI